MMAREHLTMPDVFDLYPPTDPTLRRDIVLATVKETNRP